MPRPHFLVVTFPAQGHINPALQFAKMLTNTGARVTFATSVSAYRRLITKGPVPDNLILASYSDGYDDGYRYSDDPKRYLSEIRRRGKETLTELTESNKAGGHPFTCLVYTPLLPWAAEVARESHIPVALLWVQPAATFDIYYYYFNGYANIITKAAGDNASSLIDFPGLPPMHIRDLPSFVAPSNTYAFALPAFQEQMEMIKEETNPKILINTFDALEPEALFAIPNFKMVGVGPLISPGILDRKLEDPVETSSGADLNQGPKDYTQWLDSKPKSSVIYISFGTIAVLSKPQLEELAQGLIECCRPFLWVITEKPNKVEEKEIDNIASFRSELEEIGMIVTWCSQVEVLKHKSIGCFVTHCGWNSALESLVFGVPVVAFPQWTDQMTNAWLLEDSWKTGVRVRENEKGVVESGEVRRCLEAVMEERAEELRRNANKWRELAAEAAEDGGSSDKNLKAFVDELVAESCQ